MFARCAHLPARTLLHFSQSSDCHHQMKQLTNPSALLPARLYCRHHQQTFADYNAMVAKDPAYMESGKNVEAVVRAVNLQM